jgi:hypothetical protein
VETITGGHVLGIANVSKSICKLPESHFGPWVEKEIIIRLSFESINVGVKW